jgi:hypothetical protein
MRRVDLREVLKAIRPSDNLERRARDDANT